MKKTTRSKKSATITKGARDALILDKLPGYFLVLCLTVSFVFMFYVLSPFITAILVAAVVVIAFYPIFKLILKFFRGWKRLSAFVSCLLFLLVIVAPLSLFVLLLSGEAADTYQVVQEKINSGSYDDYLYWDEGGVLYDFKESVKQQLAPVVDLDKLDIKQNIIDVAKEVSGFLASQTVNLVDGILTLILSVVIMFFSMYYFFKDGDDLVKRVGTLSPLPSVYETELFKKIHAMVKAILFGVFLTAMAQGLFGGVAFAVVGIPSPVFWGTVMAFFSMIPVVGTAIIWGPAVIILFISGQYWEAFFLLAWGVLVIGTIDNLIKPYIIGGKTHTYPLMTFFVVLGGIWTMDFKGVIIGPLVLMILMSFLHIYEIEYGKVLKK